MRCKRCGAVLKKDGDLCTKCREELNKEKELAKDTNELLRIRKKYSPKYVLTANLFEIYIFYFLLILLSVYSNNKAIIIPITVVMILIVLIIMIWQKKSSAETYISLYNTKMVYKRKFLFINKEKTIAYDDVKDIVFAQGTGWISRVFQKLFHMGNIYVYPKKGNIIMNGMQIENVANIEKVIEEIKNIVGDKIK